MLGQEYFWNISFFTSKKFLSGSYSDIIIQLHGNEGKSGNIYLKTTERLKAGSVKTFLFNYTNRIGILDSLEISIPPLVPFYYDWNLKKVYFYKLF